MPKGTKAAPPQQSNLEDMWGKNKKRPASQETRPVDKDDSEKQPGKRLPYFERHSTQLGIENSKRKQSPVPEDGALLHAGTNTWLSDYIALSVPDKPPRSKKRRVVDSDEEDDDAGTLPNSNISR